MKEGEKYQTKPQVIKKYENILEINQEIEYNIFCNILRNIFCNILRNIM
jgi:hypothetical protein